MTKSTPAHFDFRIQRRNLKGINPKRDYVLYWMTNARRCRWNFALERALEVARELNVGLIVFEPLYCDEPFASERFHRFILEGMKINEAGLAGTTVRYYPWVADRAGDDGPLLDLAADACLVVTDLFPTRPERHRIETAAAALDICLEAVDGNGLLPLEMTEAPFATAYAFRRYLHKTLPAFLTTAPSPDPLAGVTLKRPTIPNQVHETWPTADIESLLAPTGLSRLPIDHQVRPAPLTGGSRSGEQKLEAFLGKPLDDYAERRNFPDLDGTSRLSPFLHFGHLSCHQVFRRIAEREGWNNQRLNLKPTGKRSGWWGMSESAEAFLDELITWRELAFSFCYHRTDYDRYSALPDWARTTLNQHREDVRLPLYSFDEFETAATHDPLWNAAQRQLLGEGRIHGYLRMLWGKKILEWSTDPETALRIMIELNDRYALDGRDPNSYCGIAWCLGLFDRAWGPERPVFGKVRYMSSKNTARKVAVNQYLEIYREGYEP